MRYYIFTLVLMLVSFQVSGQKKSKSVDPKDAQIDSLKQTTKNLTLKLDSVSMELVKYLGVYDAIVEKVLHYKFDPTRSAYLIDSLKASRDSASALLLVSQKPPAVQPDSITAAPPLLPGTPLAPEELERAKAIGGLKQLKELLDSKVITDAEFLTLKQKYLDKL